MTLRRFSLAASVLTLPVVSHALPKPYLELDAYYSDVAVDIALKKERTKAESGQAEIQAYRQMLSGALRPETLTLEASFNPLPMAGVLIRRQSEQAYRDAQVAPSLNIIEAMTEGFQEPYALSAFFGRVLDFSPNQKTLKRKRKGFTGFLFSAGNYHILDSMMIRDNWAEVEWKFKGDLESEARKMSWSFRVGGKMHANPEVSDIYYIGLRRNRVDYLPVPLSFLLSSAIEFKTEFSKKTLKPVSNYVLLEKNFAIPNKRYAVSLGLGYTWRGEDTYSGSLTGRRGQNLARFIIQPNVKF